jgi:glutathione synthase/RimK-type ligase-like ATP-grasp enzyme
MSLDIAIHDHPGSYSDRWIEYCREHGITYRVVDCHNSDIVQQLKTADVLLWHPSHVVPADVLIARDLIQALEMAGLTVYPSTSTFWHFDNKLAQKYALEALGLPLVPTHAFFSPAEALAWVEKASFPKVFKLRRGAGSTNVQLVRSAAHARSLVKTAFGKGFKPVGSMLADARVKLKRHRRAGDYLGVLKRLPRNLVDTLRARNLVPREKGYVYFQEFCPNNAFDVRITVIGSRAFGFTRNVRRNDFRASGSGELVYDLDRIDRRCIDIAFAVAAAVGSQSLALDFVNDSAGTPALVEMSYGFASYAVHDCAGWWDRDLAWHEGHVWPEDAIIEDVIQHAREEVSPVHGIPRSAI